MEEMLKGLLSAYGSHESVAEALGYSPRHYRKIRKKIKECGEINPRIAELINLKFQQANSEFRSGAAHGSR